MKRTLLIFAAVIALVTVVTWAALGANRGWTKTSKPNGTVDEITGIVDQTPVKTFIPGLDFLGGGLVVAGIFAGVSLFVRSISKPGKNQ